MITLLSNSNFAFPLSFTQSTMQLTNQPTSQQPTHQSNVPFISFFFGNILLWLTIDHFLTQNVIENKLVASWLPSTINLEWISLNLFGIQSKIISCLKKNCYGTRVCVCLYIYLFQLFPNSNPNVLSIKYSIHQIMSRTQLHSHTQTHYINNETRKFVL